MTSFLKKLTSRTSPNSNAPHSFFDDDQIDTSSDFWCKGQIIIDSQSESKLRGYFMHKDSKKKNEDLEPMYISLYKHYLLRSQSKEKISKQHKSVDLSRYFLTMQRIPALSNKYVGGVSLSYNQKQIELFSKNKDDLNAFIVQLEKYVLLSNFEETYMLEKKLGSGSYANVYRVRSKLTHKEYAAKYFEISSFKDPKRAKTAIKNETNMHRQLEHGNICQFHEIYESSTHLTIVMEYGKGQRLIDYVIAHAPLQEKEALKIIKELLEAIHYLHSLGIIHRDIKLENVMIDKNSSEPGGMAIKLIDFGLSVTTDNIELFKRSGTPGYVAPEILVAENYGTPVDIFSLGVILFTMLSGRSPFVGVDRETVLKLNRKCEYSFKPKYWDTVTSNAKDLVKRMMEAIPEKRITAQDALAHKCFSFGNINSVHSLKTLLIKDIPSSKMSLSPNTGLDHLTVRSVSVDPTKSKTLSRDTNFTASRSIQNGSKASIYKEKRSNSKPIESLLTTSRALSNVNTHLLQIPQTNIIFVPTEGEEEKSVQDTHSDYINKGSIRSFYRLASENTEEPNSSWLKSQEKLSLISPLFPNKNTLDIPSESPRLKERVESLREVEKSLKSPFNSRSLFPSIAGSINECDISRKQSCELSFDSLEEPVLKLPKPRNVFKASMIYIKKVTTIKNKKV